MNNSNLKIGLTGGIGCGKSTVLDILKSSGYTTVDTDAICHDIYDTNKNFIETVTSRWGSKIIGKNSRIIRKEIAKIVFRDKNELKWLNNLIHPLIFNVVEKRTTTVSPKFNIIIYDVPLLFEIKWQNLFSSIISVWAPLHIQVERLKKRNWDKEEITSRISSQYSADFKLGKADFGIINSGSTNLLKKQCKNILSKIMR